jgi:class 3 adenylate cyclase
MRNQTPRCRLNTFALFRRPGLSVSGDHGGEILKFMGDGLLSIFPIQNPNLIGTAAKNALAAARDCAKSFAARYVASWHVTDVTRCPI